MYVFHFNAFFFRKLIHSIYYIFQISLTAAHCSKTLILASTSGHNGMLRQCARLLIPGLIEFVAKMAPLVHNGTIKESQSAAIGEVWKGFAGLFGWVEDRYRTLSPFFLYIEKTKMLLCLCSVR